MTNPVPTLTLHHGVTMPALGYGVFQTPPDETVGKLGVDTIDLLILHQALPSRFDHTVEAYQALETRRP